MHGIIGEVGVHVQRQELKVEEKLETNQMRLEGPALVKRLKQGAAMHFLLPVSHLRLSRI